MPILDVISHETGGGMATGYNQYENDGSFSYVSGSTINCEGARNFIGITQRTGGTAGTCYGTRDWGSDEETIVIHFRHWLNSFPASTMAILQILDSANNAIADIRITAAGLPEVYIYANTTAYTGTGVAVPYRMWFNLELKLRVNATEGTVDLKVNEVLVPGVNGITAINTRANGLARKYRFGVLTSLANTDWRYWDEQIVATDWLGKVRTIGLPLCGNPVHNWSVGGSGSWISLNGIPWPDANDANFIYAGSDIEERFDLSDLPTGATLTPLALKPLISARRASGATAVDLITSIYSGSTNGITKAHTLPADTTIRVYHGAVQNTDPNTGAAWTIAGVNSAQLRLGHDNVGTANGCVQRALVYLVYRIDSFSGIIPAGLVGARSPAARTGLVASPLIGTTVKSDETFSKGKSRNRPGHRVR